MVDSEGATPQEDGTWLINALGEPLALDWGHDGNEWQRRLANLITTRTGASGFSAKTHPGGSPPGLMFSVNGAELVSSLWAVPLAQGMLLLVSGSGAPSDAQIVPWIDAAVEAFHGTGRDQQDLPWVAIVGTKPGGIAHSPTKAIAAEVHVGGLRLIPGGHVLEEGRPPPHPSLYQTNFYASHPVIVQGTAAGYDWWQASEGAFEQLHRLCSLLSLATDVCWVVREGASPDHGETVTVPERIGIPDDLPSGSVDRVAPELVTLPAWIDVAFQRAGTDRLFANRLAGFQEGTEAQSEHPSLAAIAFVAVIESIGGVLAPSRRCKECGSLVGAGKAFKRALRVALPEGDARLLDAIYAVRSKTAHQGQLHGSEMRFGWSALGPSFWAADPKSSFEWQHLWALRKAARILLQHDVTGTLPFPEPPTDATPSPPSGREAANP